MLFTWWFAEWHVHPLATGCLMATALVAVLMGSLLIINCQMCHPRFAGSCIDQGLQVCADHPCVHHPRLRLNNSKQRLVGQ